MGRSNRERSHGVSHGPMRGRQERRIVTERGGRRGLRSDCQADPSLGRDRWSGKRPWFCGDLARADDGAALHHAFTAGGGRAAGLAAGGSLAGVAGHAALMPVNPPAGVAKFHKGGSAATVVAKATATTRQRGEAADSRKQAEDTGHGEASEGDGFAGWQLDVVGHHHRQPTTQPPEAFEPYPMLWARDGNFFCQHKNACERNACYGWRASANSADAALFGTAAGRLAAARWRQCFCHSTCLFSCDVAD